MAGFLRVSVLFLFLLTSQAPRALAGNLLPSSDPCEKVKFSYEEQDSPFYDDGASRPEHDPSTVAPKTKGLTVAAKAAAAFLRLAKEPFTNPERFCRALMVPADQLYRDSTFESTVKNDPKFFDWLKMLSCRVMPSEANNFALINTGTEYAGDDRHESGFCAGYSSLVKKFTYLAFFKPETKPQTAPTDPRARKKWLKPYFRQIDSLLEGHAESIEGFSSIADFTVVPEIEDYLKKRAIHYWKKNALNWESLKSSIEPFKKDEKKSFLKTLEEKLDRGEKPKVYFNSVVGRTAWIHTVPVIKMSKCNNGSVRAYVWDVDMFAKDQMARPMYIEFKPDGKVVYPEWGTRNREANTVLTVGPKWKNTTIQTGETTDWVAQLQSVRFTPDDERETYQIAKSLNAYCAQHPLDCLKACP